MPENPSSKRAKYEDSKHAAPLATARQLPAPETAGTSRQLLFRTLRQIQAPESLRSKSPAKTSRQLPAPDTSPSHPSPGNAESSRKKQSS
ncbi:hypothetical protein PMIN07_011708 [Paraphaeosphaeria minitans]